MKKTPARLVNEINKINYIGLNILLMCSVSNKNCPRERDIFNLSKTFKIQ